MAHQQHPIQLPHDLVHEWEDKYHGHMPEWVLRHVATEAAQWGADQELEACSEWLDREGWSGESRQLRAARRPKPPSLKEQGIKSLDNVIDCIKSLVPGASVDGEDIKAIRRALEQLPDNE